jgi:hypothetical protein
MPLNPGEVKTEHIATGAVTTPKIADEQVTSAKIKNSAVTSEKLAAGAVTGSKLADNAVTGSKIRDNTVRSEKIAAGAVTTAKIGEGQVTASRLQDRAVTSEKIARNAVTTEEIADGAVSATKLSFTPPSVARPITPPVVTDEIAGGAVTTPKIADGNVTPAKLSFTPATRPLTPPVTSDELEDASVTPAKLEAVDAPADGEVPAYNLAQDKFEWKSAGGGVTKHTDLTDKEVAGVIDHANDSIPPIKLQAIDAPADGEVPTYNQAQDKFEWKPSGGGAVEGLFVPRRVTTWDFNQTAFTRDYTWHLDGLDLSAIVPAGATAVLLRVYGVSSVAGDSLSIRTNGTDAAHNYAYLQMKVAGGGAECGQFILPIDPDRKLDYDIAPGFYSMQVHIVGWYI